MPKSWQKGIADFLGVKMEGEAEDPKMGSAAAGNVGSAFNQNKSQNEIDKFKEENKDALTSNWKFGTQ